VGKPEDGSVGTGERYLTAAHFLLFLENASYVPILPRHRVMRHGNPFQVFRDLNYFRSLRRQGNQWQEEENFLHEKTHVFIGRRRGKMDGAGR
jgi:hypothetical protein